MDPRWPKATRSRCTPRCAAVWSCAHLAESYAERLLLQYQLGSTTGERRKGQVLVRVRALRSSRCPDRREAIRKTARTAWLSESGHCNAQGYARCGPKAVYVPGAHVDESHAQRQKRIRKLDVWCGGGAARGSRDRLSTLERHGQGHSWLGRRKSLSARW